MQCHICQHESRVIFDANILGKYKAEYFRCPNCGFIQTEKPFWLEEAYKTPLSIYDTGQAQRAILWKDALYRLITKYFNTQSRFIDYGGGTGLLVRLLRDKGLDFYQYDPYAQNIFAQGFDVSNIKDQIGKVELLTAFEVFEHVEKPLELVEELFKKSDSIFFSTLLVPNDPATPTPETWGYFVPHTGQHISFYSVKALKIIASVFKCNYYTDLEDVHLLTFKELNLTDKNIRDLILPTRKMRILEFLKSIREQPVKTPIATSNDYFYIQKAYPIVTKTETTK